MYLIMRILKIIIGLIILLGIYLRLTNIGLPEFATDEAQLALGKSAAWTPFAMELIVMVQKLLGFEMIIARSVSVVFGVACLPLIYLITKEISSKRAALIALGLSAIIPTHIIFSKLAYPSVYLCFAWLLTLLMFLKAKQNNELTNKRINESIYLIGLFLAAVLSTFIKTQGLLLPLFLLIVSGFKLLRSKKSLSIVNCQLSIVLALSLAPVSFYILTKPGIFATLFLYGGNMYGTSNFVQRITDLVMQWWELAPLFLILFALSILHFFRRPKSNVRSPKLSWPIWTLILIGIINGLLLGPSHEYYTTHLIYWCIPIAMLIANLKPIWISTVLIIITAHSFVGLQTHRLYTKESYWNTHADKINEALGDANEVIALGYPGHHIRWYLKPEVLVGKNMDLRQRNGTFLLLNKEEWVKVSNGEKVYEDEKIMIVKR